MASLTKKQATEVRAYAKKVFDVLQEQDRHYGHPSHNATKALVAAEHHFDLPTYGVEGWAVDSRHGVSYLNTGDLYDLTVVLRSSPTKVRFSVECPANIIERGGKWAPR